MEGKTNKQRAKDIEDAMENLRKRCELKNIEPNPKNQYFRIIIAEEALRFKINPRQIYFILFGKRREI